MPTAFRALRALLRDEPPATRCTVWLLYSLLLLILLAQTFRPF